MRDRGRGDGGGGSRASVRRRDIAALALALALVTACQAAGGDADGARDGAGPGVDVPGRADVAGPLDAPPTRDRADGAPDACVPSCDGRDCGDDGCGGVCGACGEGSTCAETFRCVPAPCEGECAPDGLRICDGEAVVACGQHDEDPCLEWSVPEPCLGDSVCINGACVCEPDCAGRSCGDDGCGGSCGACDGEQDVCVDGVCACQPTCGGRVCGDDSCSGSCGGCGGTNETCVDGQCVCAPSCAAEQCGPDGCGGVCPHACDEQTRCTGGSCLPCGDCGTPDIEVIVRWDTGTDLDLHVVEPSGEELYDGHQSSATGGLLTLSSNPACSLDGVNAEIITWPEGAAPAGRYRVLVDFWSDCGGQDAAYTVTVRRCGREETWSGAFHAPDANHGFSCCDGGDCDGGCTTVVTFDHVPSCAAPPAECDDAADCPADGPCSTAVCVAGRCDRAPGDAPGCCDADCCATDADCGDADGCTADTCLATGRCSHAQTDAPGCCEETLWSADFDDGDGGALVGLDGGGAFAWRVRSWPAVPATSPALHFGDEAGETYGGNVTETVGRLASPPLTLPAAAAVTLTFRVFLDVEAGPTYDRFEVRLEAAGRTFVAWRKDAATPLRRWLPVTVDLSAFAGETIRVVWELRTGDTTRNVGLGVLLDDLAVTSTCAARPCAADGDCRDGLPATLESCDAAGLCRFALADPDCGQDADCDDADPCTDDRCADGTCVSAPVFGCCHGDADCDDRDACTVDVCADGAVPHCTFTRTPTCCVADADCDDDNPCTADVCLGVGLHCENRPVAGCCLTRATCDDDDDCTRDSCVDSACRHDPLCCGADAECDDGDACTVDGCFDSRCANRVAAETPGCCAAETTVADFENGSLHGFTLSPPTNGDAWRVLDATDAHGGQGVLYYGDASGAAYHSSSAGSATSPAVALPRGQELRLSFWLRLDTERLDRLNVRLVTERGEVLLGEFYGTSGWREVVADVTHLAGSTVRLRFDFSSTPYTARQGVWVDDLVLRSTCAPRPCAADGDCAAADACVTGRCLGGGCAFEERTGCCETAATCDDGDPCTTDACVDGRCTSTPGEGCCHTAGDCAGEDACLVGACVAHRCRTACDPGCADCCLEWADCNDHDPCSVDDCVAHRCVREDVCCTSDAECDDGDDVCTTDACTDGFCRNLVDATVPGCCADSTVLADFEEGTIELFTTSSDGVRGDTWAIATDHVHGGAASLHFGGPDGADFANNTRGTAVSAPILVPHGQEVLLSLWVFPELRDWSDTLQGYVDVDDASWLIREWNGDPRLWGHFTYDVTWLAGRPFQLRLEFASDESETSGGVWIDDVTLESTCAPRACGRGVYCEAPVECVDTACVDGGCDYRWRGACCDTDDECEDGDPCTIDTCQNALCVNWAVPDCCLVDADCAGGVACRASACVDGRCELTCDPGCEGCCLSASDCDDGEPCSDDACLDHACVHVWTCCDADADCDDGDDACTTDVCVEQSCRHDVETADPGCCAPAPFAWDFEAGSLGGFTITGDDVEGDTWQVVSGHARTGARSLYFGSGFQYHDGSSGEATSAPLALPPDQELTLSFWFARFLQWCCDHVQVYLDVADQSLLIGDWGGSGDWREVTYDLSPWAGQTAQLRFEFDADWGTPGLGVWIDDVVVASSCAPVACESDDDCFGAAGCMDWRCVDGGCRSTVAEDCCLAGGGCDDGDRCTSDRCVEWRCVHERYPDRPYCCEEDAECDDGNPCTPDVCRFAKCARACADECPYSLPWFDDFGTLDTFAPEDIAQTCWTAADGTLWIVERDSGGSSHRLRIDADTAPDGAWEDCVTSPDVDVDGVSALSFTVYHWLQVYDDNDLVARARLSTDGGATWTDLLTLAGSDGEASARAEIPVPPELLGAPTARVSFCLSSEAGGPALVRWRIDDVGLRVPATAPPP